MLISTEFVYLGGLGGGTQQELIFIHDLLSRKGTYFLCLGQLERWSFKGGEGQSIQRIIIMTIHNLKKNVNKLNYHSIIMQRPRIIWNFPFYRKKMKSLLLDIL